MIILDEIQKYKDCTDSFIIFDEYQEIAFFGTYEELIKVLKRDSYLRRKLSGNGDIQPNTTVIQFH